MRLGRASALSDTGRRRLQNEDAFVCDPPLFAVADGMGGARAGEIASRLATAALEERAQGLQGADAVADLVREANARIYQHALDDPAAAGMGTTVTAVLVDEAEGAMSIAHVGDSRAYRLRGGELEQLTADHSLVAELLREGRLTEEEAKQHPHRSVITRALGTDAEVQVDTLRVDARPGDCYLLCSDGLTSMIRDGEILRVAAAAAGDPERMAAALVAAANRAGGEDNVTVIVFEIVEDEEPEAEAEATVAIAPDETGEPAAREDSERQPRSSVRRHGAGPGGRWLALAGVLGALAAAIALLWWGLGG